MATVFIVYSNADGSQIADEIQVALQLRSRRLRIQSITQAMRRNNQQGNTQLRQALESSNLVVLLLTSGVVASNTNEFERVVDEAELQGKTIYPVQIDNTQLPNYVKWPGFQITSGNTTDIDQVVTRILRDVDPSLEWWKKLPLYARALVGGLVVFLGLLFAFFALFSDEDRQIFFCTLTGNGLPSCQSEATPPIEVAFPPSNTPNPPDTLVPTDIPLETDTPEPLTPTLPSAFVTCGGVMFTENFESKTVANDFVTQTGLWTIKLDGSNAIYQNIGSVADYSEIQIGDLSWHNYAIEFDIKVVNVSSARLAILDLRFSETEDQRITLILDFGSNIFHIFKSYKDGGKLAALRSRAYSFQENTWLKVSVEVQDQDTRIYLDNTYILRAEINPNIRYGLVKLKSATPFILFDNIRVSSLENCPT